MVLVSSIFILAILLSLLLTPLVMQLAFKVGAIDKPDSRKVHTKIMPRMGGMAVFLSFSICMAFVCVDYTPFQSIVQQYMFGTSLVITAFLILFALGIWDDINALKPGLKFFVQWFAATMVYIAGFHISNNVIPVNLGEYQFILNYPLTIIWIIGITNAFNLIDGLDGLAGGIGTIAALTIGVISFFYGDYFSAMAALIFAGAVFGFLRYNFNPAEIFLGDSGSLFIGFFLSLLALRNFSRSSTVYSLFIPIIVLGLPVMDTLVSMLRRFIKSYLPEELREKEAPSLKETLYRIFLPDKSHIHHQLLTRGLSHKSTVITMYLVSIIYGIGAVLISYFHSRPVSLIVSFFLLSFTLIGLNQLQYREIAIFKNGFFIPWLERLLIKHRITNRLLDIIFIGASFAGAFILAQGIVRTSMGLQLNHLHFEIFVICLTQVLVLSVGGFYKETIKQLGIGDILNILKMVVIAIAASFLVDLLIHINSEKAINLSFWLLDFYFLLTSILGLRISHPVLKYMFERYRTDQKRRVLIYGVDKKGVLALHNILTNHSEQITPVGFMDEDPDLEGNMVDGYPIFGGHWKLSRLLKTYKINQILIATESLKPVVFDRIEAIAEQHGAIVQRFHIYTEDLTYVPKEFKTLTAINI